MKHLALSRLAAACITVAAISPAMSQDRIPGSYDDRWYLTAGAGANHQDDSRDTENTAFGTIGVGKFINPDWSIDVEINHQNPKANRNEDLNFSQYGVSVDARRHFRKEGRRFNPYLLAGIGYQRAEEEFNNFPSPNSPGQDERGYATAKLGVGGQVDFKRVSLRGELVARHSFDGDSIVSPGSNGFTDTLAHVSLLVPLGSAESSQPAPMAPIIAEQHPREIETMVCSDESNNRCLSPMIIDLGTTHFDFDSARLTPRAVTILDDAIEILNRYPDLQVEVAGHTDSVGSEQYNQRLSERRAIVVYDYLVSHGISATRLDGPNGYGESQPAAPNTYPDGSDNPTGRAENRRTELRTQQ